jgi:hypothetical protein
MTSKKIGAREVTRGDRQPKTPAERTRLWRERARAGHVRLTSEADRLWLAEALFELGYLASPDQDDTDSLNAAIQTFVNELIDGFRQGDDEQL